MSLKALIDKAIETAGSQAKLADLMGVKQQHISAWKTGVRSCTTASRIELCKIANYDLKTALLEQVTEELDENDEIQKGAKEMIQAMLDAFPNRSSIAERVINISSKYRQLWTDVARGLRIQISADRGHGDIVPRHKLL